MPNFDQSRIEAARARCDKATAGPWTASVNATALGLESSSYAHNVLIGGHEAWVARRECPNYERVDHSVHGDVHRWEGVGPLKPDLTPHPDADFIAHARTDLPDAISALTAERAENERLRAELDLRQPLPLTIARAEKMFEDASLVEQNKDLCIVIKSLRAQVAALVAFARQVIEASFEGADFDGAYAQEEALRLGLIKEVPGGFDPEVHDDPSGVCEPGDRFYRLAAALAEAKQGGA